MEDDVTISAKFNWAGIPSLTTDGQGRHTRAGKVSLVSITAGDAVKEIDSCFTYRGFNTTRGRQTQSLPKTRDNPVREKAVISKLEDEAEAPLAFRGIPCGPSVRSLRADSSMVWVGEGEPIGDAGA
ncbi:MAG: hypothetical protein LQ345_004110 [Seirophora villosa]|nr:MAG: hypothetical protein LQ345_004110 [Seirophora villosa]